MTTSTSKPTSMKINLSSPMILITLGTVWLALGVGVITSGFISAPTIEIQWQTESEFDTVGFNIYRSESPDGEFVQINPQLIPSKADPTSGASYLYEDNQVTSGITYYYKLEDVEYDNSREQHDIIPQEVPRLNWVEILIAAISFVFGLALLTRGVKEMR